MPTKVEKGKFAVIDFDKYMLKCEYRHCKLCMVYSREERIECSRETCPDILLFCNEIQVDENPTPYKSYIT